MITLQLTESELRYLRFVVRGDRETLNNGDFDGDDHRQAHSDSDSVFTKIDRAMNEAEMWKRVGSLGIPASIARGST